MSMIVVASSITDQPLPDFDIAIVGSGAVGVAVATRLAGRAGKIALIEAGGPRMESRVQSRYFKEHSLSDERHPSTVLYRRRMLGGTTSVWGGRCIPLDAEDFEAGPRSPAWPISYDEIRRWTADALHYLQAGEDDFSTGALPASMNLPCVEGIRDPDILLDRIERFSEPTDVWRKWGQALVKSENIVVLQGAACTNIRTNPDAKRVTGLDLRTESGQLLQLKTSTVVLACGGLETPRLLLASRDRLSCGLGNEHDLVGRFYMTHVGGTVATLRFRDPAADRCFDYARTAEGIYARRLIKLSPEARERGEIGNIVFRPNIHPITDPSHGDSILSAMAFAKKLVIPEYSRKLVLGASDRGTPAQLFLRHGINIATGVPRLMNFGFDWLRRRILATRKLPSVFLLRRDATYPLAFDAEQSPDPDSRVSLGASADPHGMPRLAIRWRIGDADFASIERAHDVLAAALERSGLGDLGLKPHMAEELREAVGPVGGHHMGTARMGSDPRTSVVDTNGELWNTKGVFVAGGAMFPSSGFANPTLSAVALALRMAEHLKREPLSVRAGVEATC